MRLGIATVAEVDVEPPHEQMLAEVVANGSVIAGCSEIGALARV